MMPNNTPYSVEQLSPLYEDVQKSGLFEDSKYFPDCTPRQAPEAILQSYLHKKDLPDFDLKRFVEQYFMAPEALPLDYSSAGKNIEQHLHHLWNLLTRASDQSGKGTLLPLPHPYVAPGGRFREIYYWDSYFTMLGLQVSGREDLIRAMVDNFAHLILTYGFIPNGNRSYYLSRSQPPFFALMVDLLCKGNASVMRPWLPALEKEYQFWMDGASDGRPVYRRVVTLPDGSQLNRYWDDQPAPRPEAWLEDTHLAAHSAQNPESLWRNIRAAAESGWDFSTRWFEDPQQFSTIQTTALAPVDLNGLLWFLEKTLEKIYAAAGNPADAAAFLARSEQRKAALMRYGWDDTTGFFKDIFWANGQKSPAMTLAAVTPLFLGWATPAQAVAVARQLEEKFLQPGGFCTTLHISGQQWDAPNGWAPLQWMAWRGLKNYGLDQLAATARQRWLRLNESVYQATGKMMEKYNVMDLSLPAGGGEYPNQDGFGWTNGVYLRLREES